MDSLRFIPQAFYDLIARVVPGAVALCSGIWALGSEPSYLLDAFLKGAPAVENSTFAAVAVVLAGSYFTGHLLTQLSYLLDAYLLSKMFPTSFQVLKTAISNPGANLSPGFIEFLRKEAGQVAMTHARDRADEPSYRLAVWAWYDWLHMVHPETGARIGKVRAEYRMYGGAAVGLIAAVILHVVLVVAKVVQLDLILLCAGLVVAVLCLRGMARSNRIFHWSVVHAYYAAKVLQGVTNLPRSQDTSAGQA